MLRIGNLSLDGGSTELLRSCLWLVLGVYTLLVPSSRILLVRFFLKNWKATTMNRWRCADNRKPDSFCGCCTSRVGIDRIYFGSTAKKISHLRQNTHTKKRPAREDPRILRESRALAVRINQTRQSKPSFVRSDGTRSLCRRVRTALLSSPLFTCSPHICLMQPRAGRERLRRAP